MRIKKPLWDAWNKRKELILSAVFEAGRKIAKEVRIQRAKLSYKFFVKTYFPHLATCECGKFQIDAANYLKKHNNAKALFEWARGHAKSTHLSLLIPLWLKIQTPRQINTMILVSKSKEGAIMLLADLQAELENNELYKLDFGNQIAEGSWTNGRFITSDGCMFVALGRDQTPRGIKNRGNRPDYIVMDDTDDDEMSRNILRVNNAYEWALTALFGAMDMGRGRFVVVGNRISKNSIIAKFAENNTFYHTIVNALDKDGKPTWHLKYTIEEILAIRYTMGERRFNKEYMNNPITEGSIFKTKHIVYGEMLPLKNYRSIISYTDPSFKNSANSDYKATVLVGVTRTGYFHILRCFAAQCSISDMVAWHYQIDDCFNDKALIHYYMEANFIQDLVLDEFKKVGEIMGKHIPILGDHRKKPDKFARVEALQPLFERGLILINEVEKGTPGMEVLIDQLLSFERGSRSHDDAPDALEGAIFKLNQASHVSTGNFRYGKRQSFKH